MQSTTTKVILGLVIILQLWLILFSWLFPPPSPSFQISQRLNEPKGGQWNWFDMSKKPPPKTVERSKIQADLVGLIHTQERKVAIISTKKSKFKVYTEGDRLQQGVTLEEIYPDRVILDEYGAERELRPIKGRSVMEIVDNEDEKIDQEVGDPSVNTEGVLPSGIGDFADIVNVLPVRTDDGGSGLKLQGLNEDLVEISGLGVNDIVLSIDNQPIQNIVNNPSAIRELMQRGDVNVNIIRDGEPSTVTVDIKTLAARVIPLIGNRSLR